MAVMIENHRSGFLWKLFMSNPEIEPALSRLGSSGTELAHWRMCRWAQ
jgi:hypothetical protein